MKSRLVALLIVAIASPTQAEEKKDEKPKVDITAKPGKGFTFSTGDLFSMTLRGRMMMRYTFVEHDGAQHEFSIRRARIYLGGHTFSKNIQYYFHVAFAQQDFDASVPTISPLYDAYLQLTPFRDLNFRIGQQLVPYNRARVISSQNAELVDRSPVNAELNLDRDVGIKIYSHDLGGLHHVLGYELYAGMGDGRNQLMGNMGMLYAARVQLNPMGKFEDYHEADIDRTPTPHVSFGINAAYSHDAVRQRVTTGNRFPVGDFDYAHGAIDTIFKYRGFSFMAELLARRADKDRVQGVDAMGAMKTDYSRSATGYFVQAGFVFSKYNFGIAARWSQLFANRLATDPTLIKLVVDQGKEMAAGLSWYIHGHVLKVQADYAYLFGDDFSEGRHNARLQLHVGY